MVLEKLPDMPLWELYPSNIDSILVHENKSIDFPGLIRVT